ncbi:hypothetical protein EI94DRAFT_1699449 [Lactarius quietus]|nr:hypothetical protein EI94DRAFT_1699449 [Lactarius quietus]
MLFVIAFGTISPCLQSLLGHGSRASQLSQCQHNKQERGLMRCPTFPCSSFITNPNPTPPPHITQCKSYALDKWVYVKREWIRLLENQLHLLGAWMEVVVDVWVFVFVCRRHFNWVVELVHIAFPRN